MCHCGSGLIFYGKFQEHISERVHIFKQLSYHFSLVSRDINFTWKKTSAHVSVKTQEDEEKSRERRSPSPSIIKKKEKENKEKRLAQQQVDFDLSTQMPALLEGSVLCFSQLESTT